MCRFFKRLLCLSGFSFYSALAFAQKSDSLKIPGEQLQMIKSFAHIDLSPAVRDSLARGSTNSCLFRLYMTCGGISFSVSRCPDPANSPGCYSRDGRIISILGSRGDDQSYYFDKARFVNEVPLPEIYVR